MATSFIALNPLTKSYEQSAQTEKKDKKHDVQKIGHLWLSPPCNSIGPSQRESEGASFS